MAGRSGGGRSAPTPRSSTSTGRRARGTRGKLTLPVLGDQYGKVLEAGDLKLQFDAAAGTFHVAYYDQRFPIGVRRYPQLLRSTANLLDRGGIPLFELADRFAALYPRTPAPSKGGAPAGGVRAEGGAGRGRERHKRPRGARCHGRRAERHPRPARDLRAAARAFGGSGLPPRLLAGRQLRRSTTAASSTSTSWPVCAWSRARCSRPPIACCCA